MDGNLVARWTRGEISTGNADAFQFASKRPKCLFSGRLDDLRVYDSVSDLNRQIFSGKDATKKLVQHQFDILGWRSCLLWIDWITTWLNLIQ